MKHEEADYLQHYGVLGMKWGQRRARINAVKSSRAQAKGKTEKAAKFSDKSKRIEAKHRSRAGNKAYNRVAKTKTGKLIAQSLVMGRYGTLKYHQAKSKGDKTGKAVVKALLYQGANTATSGVMSIVEPRLNAKNRKKK